jgi:LPS-assembly protein
MHMSQYELERRTTTGDESISRTLPIFSVDAGMTFEREVEGWGAAKSVQTLEPRLYYLNIPYKDQSNIPVFDSGLADFNFAQIFSENPYVGYDRIADANQLTAAVSSRLILPETGGEYLRAMLGQRFYFRNQQVTLPNQTLAAWNKSDFLASLSGLILPKTWLDTAVQYNPGNARFERYHVGTRYAPAPGKILNLSYRFNRETIENLDVSGQWPLWRKWSAVGRYNYSFKDGKPVETIGGLEYNAGCWAFRVVAHQLATLSGQTNTSFFIQLELNDFARIGSNPIDLLKRNIPGYGLGNQPVADPIFGE